MTVFVQGKHGNPIMPTTRCGHVRHLLQERRAIIVQMKPFTIRLLYDGPEIVQPVTVGIDPGRTNIGLAAVREDGNCLMAAELITRNLEVTKGMKERKVHRMERKRNKRNKKKRRAKRNHTRMKIMIRRRILRGCEEPITVKEIKNKEARFNNRKREEEWLTPTVRHLIDTHINFVKKVQKLLPIQQVVIEYNKFDFHLMLDPMVGGIMYQRGKLLNFDSAEAYIFAEQQGKCLLCGADIKETHHIVPRSKGGSESYKNKVGLCHNCHASNHMDPLIEAQIKRIKRGCKKQFAGTSILNIAMKCIVREMIKLFGEENVILTAGNDTKDFREDHNITKSHANDAYCIACSTGIEPHIETVDTVHLYKQFRRQDRAVVHKQNIDRKYYHNGQLVATNRNKRFEQKTDSLAELRAKDPDMIADLTVKEHKPITKRMDRVMPGSIMKVGKRHKVMVASHGTYKGKPVYYIMADGTRHKASSCVVVAQNVGIVCIDEQKIPQKI